MLQWGHALSGMDTGLEFLQGRRIHGCFNGAMPFQAWIHLLVWTVHWDAAGLQWGHALSGMDT